MKVISVRFVPMGVRPFDRSKLTIALRSTLGLTDSNSRFLWSFDGTH